VRLETMAVHAGRKAQARGVVEPIGMSVTYERDADGGHSGGYYYSTAGNPNRDALEECVRALEQGAAGVAFSSGSAAIAAVLKTLDPGDHVIVPADVFQGTIRILRDVLARWGLSHTVADLSDPGNVQSAFRPSTKLVWAEALSNPLLQVADVEELAEVAHRQDALLVVDNTFVTPVFQRPLALGADVVVHATTKYLGGHGDVVGGVVVTRQPGEPAEAMRHLQRTEGAVPSPFDCWLVLRGIKTLPHRMRAHADSALAVAEFLSRHRMVEAVHYPGLLSHRQHSLAKRVLEGFGGVVSFQIRGEAETALQVASSTEIFKHATSLGQADSLIQHQASSPTHGPGTGLAENLLRLSVGLEHPDDLIDDLDRALETAAQRSRS